jgi:hypothetical protein
LTDLGIFAAFSSSARRSRKPLRNKERGDLVLSDAGQVVAQGLAEEIHARMKALAFPCPVEPVDDRA